MNRACAAGAGRNGRDPRCSTQPRPVTTIAVFGAPSPQPTSNKLVPLSSPFPSPSVTIAPHPPVASPSFPRPPSSPLPLFLSLPPSAFLSPHPKSSPFSPRVSLPPSPCSSLPTSLHAYHSLGVTREGGRGMGVIEEEKREQGGNREEERTETEAERNVGGWKRGVQGE